ncbi:MAG: glycosyltransferase [Candidatus Wallbacteria bacterium]|nr:glycosyltransferase [Candidatus Wallbacteria bacterium]
MSEATKSTSVLMISVGEHMLADRLSDARARHIEYGTHVKTLIIIAYASYHNRTPLTWISNNVAVHPTHWGKWLFPLEALFLGFILIRRHKLNVITTQDPFVTGLIGLILKLVFGLKIEIQNHSDFYSSKVFLKEKPLQYGLFYRLGMIVLRFGDFFRVLNEEEKEVYATLGVPRELIRVLPTPVNSERFLSFIPAKKISSLRRRFNAESLFVLIWVGRVTPAKDWPLLLKIASKAKADALPLCIFMAGDGEESDELDRSIAKEMLESMIVRTGRVTHEDLPVYYQTADAYIHTSSYEGFGKTIVEAMLSGLPVVTSDTSGARSIVLDGETGFIVKTREPEDFLAAVKLLASDSQLRRKMGSMGRKHAQEHYDHNRSIAAIADIWIKLSSNQQVTKTLA